MSAAVSPDPTAPDTRPSPVAASEGAGRIDPGLPSFLRWETVDGARQRLRGHLDALADQHPELVEVFAAVDPAELGHIDADRLAFVLEEFHAGRLDLRVVLGHYFPWTHPSAAQAAGRMVDLHLSGRLALRPPLVAAAHQLDDDEDQDEGDDPPATRARGRVRPPGMRHTRSSVTRTGPPAAGEGAPRRPPPHR